MFAITASVLVQEYALFAKHSGIPEIKTVLGGFIIKRFMGSWTLAIKSLGLVSQLAILCLHSFDCISALLLLQECGSAKRALLYMLHAVVQVSS